jgi:DNA-binding transcriptional MocR family regulator
MLMPIEQIDLPPGHIDLGSGNPSNELLPIEIIERASTNYFSARDQRTLQYGAERGNGNFLASLAEFLSTSSQYDMPTKALLTTNGASAALDLLCTLYTKPGDLIFVEEPTYFLARRIFADHHLQVEAVSMDKDGLDIEQLEEKLHWAKPKFIYSVPTFHNPASVTLTQDRREQLVNLSQQNDFLIIADEVYHFLAYDSTPPKPMAAFANQAEQVISINSFSKILSPGLRLGWIQAHPKVIKRLAECGLLHSGGGLNPFTSGIVFYLIQAGDLAANIIKLKREYQKRLVAMNDALTEYLPEADYLMPHGGYNYWVQLPGLDTSQLRDKAQKSGIDFRPGTLFSSQMGLQEYIRLSFSFYNAPQIKIGVKKLAECLHECR